MPTPPAGKRSKQDEGRSKMVTLEDVAKVAGVTSMTVSRAIKGKSDISVATREKVLRIARELNYTANLTARALKTGRTGTIAIISGALDQPYSANIVCLLDAALTSSGYQMKLLHTRDQLNDLVGSTSAAAVDGVIVAGMHGLVNEICASGNPIVQPCVFIGITKPNELDHVYSNLAPAVEEAVKRMIATGRKRIAYVGVGVSGENLSSADTEVRTRAYLGVMEEAGHKPELISASPTYEVSGPERVRILKEYFQAHGCPEGLLCVNDDIAIQTYRALMDLAYKIPEDVLLVGCDGLPIMEYLEPPLSTIAQPMEEMCTQAWKFLQARIAKPEMPLQHASFDAQLVVRRSLLS
jgi:DNA-binding LacI/PurR family transcriptional regulator